MTGVPGNSAEGHLFGSSTVTLLTGTLVVILGAAGIILPALMSLATVLILGWLLLLGGLLWGFHTLKHARSHFGQWLKPVLLVVTGGLMLFYPISGVAAVALLLTVYLLMDSYGSFTLAHMMRPARGTGWMTFNGIVSLVLAILFLIGWPEASMWLVGLFVGISLLFDGWALIAVGWFMRGSA